MTPVQYEELCSLLNDISTRLDRLERRFDVGGGPAPAAALQGDSGPPEGAIADDKDLDGSDPHDTHCKWS